MRISFLIGCLVVVLALGSHAEEAKMKVGFIYYGKGSDRGWSSSHEEGRKELVKTLPWVETLVEEAVPSDKAEAVMDDMIAKGAKIIFATSTKYQKASMAAAIHHPDILFANCAGIPRRANLCTYSGEPNQIYYLEGLISGALSKTGKIGYVAAYAIPELKRLINVAEYGFREVQPQGQMLAAFTNDFYDAGKATVKTEELIAQGADVLLNSIDPPVVVEVGAKHGIPGFSKDYSMYETAPDYVVSGDLLKFAPFYIHFVKGVRSGKYTNQNLAGEAFWWLLAEDAVEFAAKPGMMINPKYIPALKAKIVKHPEFGSISVYDLVLKRLAQMKDHRKFEAFTGPLYDRKGKLQAKAGYRLTPDDLHQMEWAAPGVLGDWPNEP
jgi:simple sugar transport system substrate-binding protein